MTDRPFRFGVALFTPSTRAEWVSKLRTAEELGYDIVSISDNLGLPAPVPTLLLAAEATDRIRIGTLVLNASFYRPALLARDLATINEYSGGRLEIGLGTGYDRAQFDIAGVPWADAPQRVSQLARTVEELRGIESRPPILIAGRSDRVLRLAAAQADIIAFPGTEKTRDSRRKLGGLNEVTGRIECVHALLGDRIDEAELNIAIHRVLPPGTTHGVTDAWQNHLDLEPAELAELPTLLIGTPEECADILRDRRKRYGLTYFTVLEPEMEAFAPIIEAVR
ncbi:TIGR03621 family F420-dependent LLM class oxidoreductase [Kibdelosporangium aridum]|uniref:TIGR03621 family F420-dependent LLM class oxidoreductase n=1 Tax=Kibdelosporangium aridum TaxID=2030 RepID=A0A428ZCA1_KIBAR|nr:TIGR03621 family F420-dependent LLM class oxidoreductase [Kibdelosporangium aridum]RSM85685.1 TIGR03621 family F420-dependent LLM class oxidoreductase [Kibdelosporangium aridum]